MYSRSKIIILMTTVVMVLFTMLPVTAFAADFTTQLSAKQVANNPQLRVQLNTYNGVGPITVTEPGGLVSISKPIQGSGGVIIFMLTPLKEGIAKITARDANGRTATVQLTIGQPDVPPTVKFNTNGFPKVGDTFQVVVERFKGIHKLDSTNPGLVKITKTSTNVYTVQVLAEGSAKLILSDHSNYRVEQSLTISKPMVMVNMKFTAFPEGTLRVIDVGQSTPLVISGGTAPYIVTADRPSAVTIQQQGTGQYAVTGREAGVIGINVRDQKGNTRSMSLTVRALPTLTVAGPSAMTVGQTATLSLIGGVAPLTVTSSGNQVTLTRQDEKRFQIVARTPGTVTITVRDGKGTVKTLPITVSAPKPPATPKLEAVASNNTIYLVPTATNRNFCIVTVRGGQGNYQLTPSPAIVTIIPQGKTATGSMAYAITARARGTTNLTITDQSGQKATVTIKIL